MDTLTRQLVIEIARTVLRVLDAQPAKAPPPPAPPPAKAPPPPAPAAPAPPVGHARGSTVRFWDGHRYSIGTVASVCRRKEGQPPRVNVYVERAGSRGKTYRIETAKAEILKGGAP